jgi:hypothetical protein
MSKCVFSTNFIFKNIKNSVPTMRAKAATRLFRRHVCGVVIVVAGILAIAIAAPAAAQDACILPGEIGYNDPDAAFSGSCFCSSQVGLIAYGAVNHSLLLLTIKHSRCILSFRTFSGRHVRDASRSTSAARLP